MINKRHFKSLLIFFLITLAAWFSPSPLKSENLKNLKEFVYKEDFESNELNGWASYPLWQDMAYDPNLRPGKIVPGEENLSLYQRVTPYSNVDNYAGAQKKLSFILTPTSSLKLRYYLKTHLKPEYLKVRLAAGEKGILDYVVSLPATNTWVTLSLSGSDFFSQISGNKLAAIKIFGVAVLAKIPKADPSMPIYFGLDDILIQAQAVPDFEFIQPEMIKLEEWEPYITKKHFQKGDILTVKGQWPVQANQVILNISNFAEPKKVLSKFELKRISGNWGHSDIKLVWPEGLYLGKLEAYQGSKKVAETKFTFVIAPQNLAGRHPRLWFDSETLKAIKERLGQEKYKSVAANLSTQAKEAREKTLVEKVVFDLDAFPKDEPTLGNVPRSLYPWYDRLNSWRRAVSSNALASSLLDDKEAGVYVKFLIIKLAGFPFWLHPWFESRGQHIYYPVGELGMDVALAYDLVYELMTEEEKQAVRTALWKNIVVGCHRSYVEDNLVTSNTSNWIAHITGGSVMSQLAIYADGQETEKIEPYFTGVLLKLYEFINKSIGQDGGYGESYGYCNFTMQSLSKALPALANVFNIKFFGNIHLTYQDMIWATHFDKKFICYFGDSSGNLGPMTNWAWYLFFSQDPVLSWLYQYLKKEDTIQDVIYETDKVRPQSPFKNNPVKLFRDIGTTVFRSGWGKDDFIFVLRTGPFYNHQHLDQGTFWLIDKGKIFIGERHGSTYYDDVFYQSHYTQPVAHSTILIDHNPQSQRVGDPRGFIDGFQDQAFVYQFLDGQNASFVSGDLTKLYWGKAQEIKRNVLYLKPRTVLMIDSILPATQDMDVTLLYQAGALVEIQPDLKTSIISKENERLFIAHIWPEKIKIEKEETPIYINTLKTEYPLIPEGMLTLTSRTARGPLLIANLLTTIDRSIWQNKISKGQGYCYGQIGNQEFVFSTNPGKKYEASNWLTDALALAWNGDNIFVALGNYLEREQKLILVSSEPITCELTPDKVKYSLTKPANIRLGLKKFPTAVLLNNKNITSFIWDEKKGELKLTLPAGEGELYFKY